MSLSAITWDILEQHQVRSLALDVEEAGIDRALWAQASGHHCRTSGRLGPCFSFRWASMLAEHSPQLKDLKAKKLAWMMMIQAWPAPQKLSGIEVHTSVSKPRFFHHSFTAFDTST